MDAAVRRIGAWDSLATEAQAARNHLGAASPTRSVSVSDQLQPASSGSARGSTSDHGIGSRDVYQAMEAFLDLYSKNPIPDGDKH